GSAARGAVTLDGTPSSPPNIQAITGLTFQGRYTHSTGVAMDQVQVELYQGNTLLDSSGTITKSVASSAAPGTLFSLTQTELGFTGITWGIEYGYRMRAHSTNGAWSNWTNKRIFQTNVKHNIPSNLEPANNEVVTDILPLLQCQMTDADAIQGLL